MKKMIKIVIALGILFLLYQFFILFLVSNHKTRYSVKTEDNSYMVDEQYKKYGKFNMYYLKFEDKDKNSFVATYDVGYNRQSEIVKDIRTYNDGNLYCIAPVLKDKDIQYISCKLNGNQVSVSYLRQIGNSSIDDFIAILKTQGYNLYNELDIQNSIVKAENNVSVYGNLDEKLYLTVWGYKGVYTLNGGHVKYSDFLEKDIYANEYGILCGKYYVVLSPQGSTIGSFYVVNIKEGGKVQKDVDYSISKNTYINGIYKNKVYLTDIDNKVQYAINPITEKMEEIGGGSDARYYDGSTLQKVDISSLTKEKKYFIQNAISQELISKNGEHNYMESYGNNYYQDGTNIYQVVGKYYDNKVLLFTSNDLKEVRVLNNNVFFIAGDNVFMYNNETGLKKAINYREFVYNYKNMYDVYIDDK